MVLVLLLQLASKAKVANLCVSLGVNEDVLWLEISVNYVVFVDDHHPVYNLAENLQVLCSIDDSSFALRNEVETLFLIALGEVVNQCFRTILHLDHEVHAQVRFVHLDVLVQSQV